MPAKTEKASAGVEIPERLLLSIGRELLFSDGQEKCGDLLIAVIRLTGVLMINFKRGSRWLGFYLMHAAVARESMPGKRKKPEVTVQCHFKVVATVEASLSVIRKRRVVADWHGDFGLKLYPERIELLVKRQRQADSACGAAAQGLDMATPRGFQLT